MDVGSNLNLSADGGNRSFLNLVAGTAGVNIGVSLTGSLGGVLLARSLGAGGRGDLATIIIWPTLVGNLATIGLPQATCYWVARRPSRRNALLSTALAWLFALGLAVAALGCLASGLIGRSAAVTAGLRVNFASTPVVFVLAGLLSALQATSPKRWNACRFVQPVTYFVAVVALLIAGRLTLATAVASLIMSLVVQLVVVVPTVWRAVGPLAGPERELSRPLFNFGVRSIVSSAPWLVNGRLDQLILSVAVSSAALGNYAVAVSLSFLVAPVSTAFGTMAFPKIAATTDASEARTVQRMAIRGCLFTAIAVVLPLAVLAPWLVSKVFGGDFSGAAVALRLLAPGAVAFSTNQVMSDILRGLGRPLSVAIAEGVAAIVTVVLLAFLIPKFGINGAAFASSVAYCVSSAMLVAALRKGGPPEVAEVQMLLAVDVPSPG